MKNRHILFAFTASLALACSTVFGASQIKAYKWIDKDGGVHYGDTVPPEYAEQAHQELNQQGVAVRNFPAQMSPAEAAIAQKNAADQARQHQHDSFLLNSYTKASDIEQLRDERLALINSQMGLARGSITAADQRLVALRARLGNFSPYSSATTARRVPDQLAEEVVRTLSDRRSMNAQLQQREKEKADQLASFNADIARYNELTSGSKPR